MPNSPASEGSGPRTDAPPEAQHGEQAAPEARPAESGQGGQPEARPAEPDAAQQPAPPQDGGDGGSAQDELARSEDRLRRALADLDNYRKRAAREIERRSIETRETLLRDWFDVVDTLERAIRMDPDNPLTGGLRALLDQIEGVLRRQGVERIGTQGEPFDPERHEAIDVRTDDGVPDRTVLETARSGFAHGDRVLRPAQVVVSRRSADEG